MDRPMTRTEADARASRADPDGPVVLPSRRIALDLCRAASGAGPVLVTGEAGAGKTWLWRALQAESPPDRRRVGVDLTPSDGPADFYRLVARELGLIGPGIGPSRVELADFLQARQADGERFQLVVDEAQNLSPELWEEVRVLANRLDRPGGFGSMILVGQTPLALRFATRPFAAIEARLASKVHLGPIGVDEASTLLALYGPARGLSGDEVEVLHRDSSGNPRRLLRLAGPCDPPISAPRSPGSRAIRGPSTADASAAPPAPLTGPERPPIRVEENMIEVGWTPEDTPPTPGHADGPARRGQAPTASAGEESVRDHYAALQAWREWAENQSKAAPRPAEAIEADDEEEPEEPDDLPGPRVDRPSVRVEGEQKFAPFGHLFSRMSQALEPE